MKKLLAVVLVIVFLLVFVPACDANRTIRFQLKIPDSLPNDYFICAEGQEIKQKLELENFEYTEGLAGMTPYRIYEVSVKYPCEVNVREDGRSFWTFYTGFIYKYSETFSDTLKNVGIRSGETIVDLVGDRVLYDTVKTVYDDGNFTFYAGEGMESSGNMLHDIQFIWYEDENGQRKSGGEFLPGAKIQLLGENAPNLNGDVETWFSVISGAEGMGEIDRFCVTTKSQEPQPECTLTYDDLPDVVSEKGAKWLEVSEFAADGIKPDTDVAAMKAAFGEPMSSRYDYGDDVEYIMYQYDGVIYTFEMRLFNGDEWQETNQAYCAEFTKNLLKFPRGVQIGDRFEDVLKKFPQELDYKDDISENLFYGDYWRKDKLGWGSVSIGKNKNGVWINVICDEYWPMLKVHFTDELIADKIVVQFGPSPYYD